MKSVCCTDEIKTETIKQITERGHGVLDVGVSDNSFYLWLKQNREQASPKSQDIVSLKQKLMLMKAGLKRITEERNILKKGRVLCYTSSLAG